MKKYLVLVVLSIVFLGGCATTPQYTNIGGSSGYNRQNSSVINGRNTGAVLGGVAGAAAASMTKTTPAVGLLMTVVGAVTGGFFGNQYDERAAAVGTTDCGYSAQKSGTDRNGNYYQTAGSHKTVSGYKADCN